MRTLSIFLLALLPVSCGGSLGSSPDPATDAGDAADAAAESAPPDSSTRDAGPDVVDAEPPGTPVFAFQKIYWGDTDRNDVPNQSAWKEYGHDIDEKVT